LLELNSSLFKGKSTLSRITELVLSNYQPPIILSNDKLSLRVGNSVSCLLILLAHVQVMANRLRKEKVKTSYFSMIIKNTEEEES
jgi:hypothetical protein